ncbi:MAG TPA: ribonuclease P protein component [Tepidisphaeraceae bacterium]|nr:ribonuclease P protein component [Tepidisphaeraceae bacterium]
MPAARPYPFARRHRLTHARQFQAVYEAKTRQSRGPLTIFALPNDLTHPRLGLSVGRKVGIAPKRNRIKRLLREAFRMLQHDWPAGYDVVINVRPHDVLLLADYQRILSHLMVALHKEWQRKSTRIEDGG